MKSKLPKIKTQIIWVVLILLAAGWFLFRAKDYSGLSDKIDTIVSEQLRKFGVTNSNLLKETRLEKSRLKTKWLLRSKEYVIPAGLSLNKFLGVLEKAVTPSGFRIVKRELYGIGQKEVMAVSINFKNLDVYRLKLSRISFKIKKPFLARPVKPARIAIVIDDWGYNLNNIELLSGINQPLTLAILPNLAYSREIAKLTAQEKNRQVIVHLPLEPHNSSLRLEENTIMSDMDKKQVVDILNKTLLSVPYAKGFSNHRGSKVTEDSNIMKIILAEIKKRNLFFLDSLATNKSVAEILCEELDVKFAKRSIFLDNMDDTDYIKRQLAKLVNLALRAGRAIGIGHDRPTTLKVLKEMLPQLQAEGIDIVFLSDLVQ